MILPLLASVLAQQTETPSFHCSDPQPHCHLWLLLPLIPQICCDCGSVALPLKQIQSLTLSHHLPLWAKPLSFSRGWLWSPARDLSLLASTLASFSLFPAQQSLWSCEMTSLLCSELSISPHHAHSKCQSPYCDYKPLNVIWSLLPVKLLSFFFLHVYLNSI